MLYIIPNSYEPNTAATNRALALFKGLSVCFQQTRDRATVVFFEPSKNHDIIDDRYYGISIEYLWKNQPRSIKPILRRLLTILYQVKFYISLCKGDSVFILGNPHLLGFFLHKRDVHIYHELNEHPTVVPLGPKGQKVSLEKYLRNCRKLDGLFVISYHLKEYFKQNGVDEKKIYLYKMMVDPERFDTIRKTSEKEPYIAYCGTATNYKDGVDVLLQAFSIVKRKYKGGIKLHIYGKVPSETERQTNDELIMRLGIKDDVLYKGIVSAKEMPQRLKDAAVLALARPDNIQAKYGFPTKLGEYLLTGNPVVVTSVGDIPLYLRDGENALLAEPNNPQSFANKMLWVLCNKEAAKKIGDRGRQTALEYFNPVVEADNILKVIYKAE